MCVCIYAKIKIKHSFLQCYKLFCGEPVRRRFIGYHYMHASCCHPSGVDCVASR